MPIRFIALCSDPFDASWPQKLERDLRACDWSISAEWAGVDDDDEAAALVEPLARARPVIAGSEVTIDFGQAGLLSVSAIGADEVATVCEAHAGPEGDCVHGLCFTIGGGSGVEARIVAEAVQAIAIGMAGSEGWVLVPTGAWWSVADGAWVRR
jgi:hypothetical protein